MSGTGATTTGGESSTPLVESLVSGDREGVGGILCNDPSGLCLGARGAMDTAEAGVFTNLVKLAAQLEGASSSNDSPSAQPALITIESEDSHLLVKEYGGHAVALRVPAAVAKAAPPETITKETESSS